MLLIYAPTLRTSGVGSFTAGLCTLMEERGWEVTVGLAWGAAFHDPRLFRQQYPGIRTILMDGRTGSEEGRIQALCRTIRKVNPHILLHSCLNSAFAAVRRLRGRGEGNFTFCVVNHGSFPEHAATLLVNRDVVDQVVCVSRWSYLALLSGKVTFTADRVHHMPNMVSPPTAPPGKRGGGAPRIGYAGRLMPDKRFRDIFPFFRTVAATHPDAELWIAGDGPYAEESRSFCREFPGRVRYWGAVSREELYRSFYPELDLFVNFSPAEAGKSLAICEAMAHGVVPVVAEYTGFFLERFALPNRTALLFPVGESGAAARLAGALLDNPVQLQAISREARELMAREYPLELFARQWGETLEGFLSLPRLPAAGERNRDSLLEGIKERLRRLLGRHFPHRDPGGEWPHFSCKSCPELVVELRSVMAKMERDERERVLSGVGEGGAVARLQAELLRGDVAIPAAG